MQFSNDIQQKINDLYCSMDQARLVKVQQTLTERYKHASGKGESLIKSRDDSVLYAISRMPATYSVIATLLMQLVSQNNLSDIKRAMDIGSGTGSGYFALKFVFGDIDISLVERDQNMISVFESISEQKGMVHQLDIVEQNLEFDGTYDLVICSYVLSELSEQCRESVMKKLLNLGARYLLIIDTGTPKIYQEYMKLKEVAKSSPMKLIAPCMSDVCPLADDYCQFYARVERSSLHRRAKASAVLPYEDEKYFYLLFSDLRQTRQDGERVIRRPETSTNITRLKLCTANGVIERTFSKHDKEQYKRSKKVKINDIF